MKLISAATHKIAETIARDKGLTSVQWYFIPHSPENIRQERLRGWHAPEEDLIGYFSTEERMLLKR